MTDITGGDIEVMARLMSAERLAVKRAHAARHPEGRTAELVAHIEAQEGTTREQREALKEAAFIVSAYIIRCGPHMHEDFIMCDCGNKMPIGQRWDNIDLHTKQCDWIMACAWLAAHKEECHE